MKPLIIGFGHKARVGKDTAAAHLAWRARGVDFEQEAFANAVKYTAQAAFGFSADQVFGNAKEFIDPYWGLTPRVACQKVGTELFRAYIDSDFWVKRLYRRLRTEYWREFPTRSIAISDVRFPNEAEAIKSWGGYVVKIDRPGAEFLLSPEARAHESETALDNYDGWDYVIQNDGTLEEFHTKLDAMLAHFKHERGK